MKYLKTYDGLFDVFKSKSRLSDENTIKDYINLFDNQQINFGITLDSGLQDYLSMTTNDMHKSFSYEDLTITKYRYDKIINSHKTIIKIDNKELSVSESIKDELWENISHIFYNTVMCVSVVSEILKINKEECQERLLEFEVDKDGSLDKISLQSVFDFYEVVLTNDMVNKLQSKINEVEI